MPKKKISLEEYKKTQEYQLWYNIEQLCNQYDLSGDNYITRKDLGGFYWEPLWERIYKFGVLLKHTPKNIKYIKGEWMRPLLYLESQSQDVMNYDGFSFRINKTANASAINLRFALKRLLDSLCKASSLTDETFQKDYQTMKEDDKYFFNRLKDYVQDGYRPMHENLKFLLEPLRLLRKGGYRLFSYEQKLENNIDLNLFKDKNRFNIFVNNITEQFKYDEILSAKNNTQEELDLVMKTETNPDHLKYVYNEKKLEIKEQKKDPYASIAHKTNHSQEKVVRLNKKEMKKKLELQLQKEKEKENKIIHKIVYPNLPNLKQKESLIFEKDALIKDFENGFKAMLIYLNQRFLSQIPEIIDPHKMTVNLEEIPKLSKKNSFPTSFYIKKLEESLYDLKKMCYEMKLNGINRILLPISANIDFTTQVKIVYDNHVNIDKIMGDTLKLEQYLFIYDKIDYISKSNLHSELLSAKDKYLMETGISKFIFYEGLCHSVDVLLKMRKDNRLNEIKYDNMDNFFQLTKLNLDSLTDFNSFNYYNFENYTHDITNTYATDIKNEIKKDKLILLEEIKKFGRFFIFENFMDPNEKNNWIELVNQLIEINSLVREDIRDFLLKDPKNIKKKKNIQNENNNLNESNNQSTDHKKKNHSKKHSKNNSRNISRRNSKMMSVKKSTPKINNLNIQIDDDENNYLKNINTQKLKPPFVWNFPLWKVKSLKKQRNLTTVIGNEISTSIPDFDKLYVDGRIQKFLDLFEIMFNNNMTYCKEKMNNNWEYMLYKQYEIFGINYGPFKTKFYRKIDLVPPKPKNLYDDDEEIKNKEDEIEEDIQIEDN